MLGSSLQLAHAETVSLKLCPDYDTRFVRDRPLWMFVVLLSIWAALMIGAVGFALYTYIQVQLSLGSLTGSFSIWDERTVNMFAMFFVVALLYGFWPFLVTRPWKISWYITNVILFLWMVGGIWSLATHVFMPSPYGKLLGGYRLLETVFTTLDAAIAVILFLWWYRRRVMYGITRGLLGRTTEKTAAEG